MNISSKAGVGIVKMILILFAVMLSVTAYVFYQSYQGRRVGCERSKLDRIANAKGWRTAEAARLHTAAATLHISLSDVEKIMRSKPTPNEIPDIVAARRYRSISTELDNRSLVNCNILLPKVDLK